MSEIEKVVELKKTLDGLCNCTGTLVGLRANTHHIMFEPKSGSSTKIHQTSVMLEPMIDAYAHSMLNAIGETIDELADLGVIVDEDDKLLATTRSVSELNEDRKSLSYFREQLNNILIGIVR